MDQTSEVKTYSRLYRWLGLCTDYYAASEDEDDQEIAKKIRKDPVVVLEALVQIRMTLITFKMTNVTHSADGGHTVTHNDLKKMTSEFPPSDFWWKVWLRYLDVMDDAEWNSMWTAADYTIEEQLSAKSSTRNSPSLYDK